MVCLGSRLSDLRSLLQVSLSKMVLRQNADVLASVPEPKKAVKTEKMRGLDKVPSGVSHSAASRVQCSMNR